MKMVRRGKTARSAPGWFLETYGDRGTLDMLYRGSALTWEGIAVDPGTLDRICEVFAEKGLWAYDDMPVVFYCIEGEDMNRLEGLTGDNAYPDGLHILSIPNDQLNIDKMIPIQLNFDARWMDDIVDNNRMREGRARGTRKRASDWVPFDQNVTGPSEFDEQEYLDTFGAYTDESWMKMDRAGNMMGVVSHHVGQVDEWWTWDTYCGSMAYGVDCGHCESLEEGKDMCEKSFLDPGFTVRGDRRAKEIGEMSKAKCEYATKAAAYGYFSDRTVDDIYNEFSRMFYDKLGRDLQEELDKAETAGYIEYWQDIAFECIDIELSHTLDMALDAIDMTIEDDVADAVDNFMSEVEEGLEKYRGDEEAAAVRKAYVAEFAGKTELWEYAKDLLDEYLDWEYVDLFNEHIDDPEMDCVMVDAEDAIFEAMLNAIEQIGMEEASEQARSVESTIDQLYEKNGWERVAHRKRAYMDENDILDTIAELSLSQGFYGRMLEDLMYAEENNPGSYWRFMDWVISQNPSDPVDLVMLLES